MTFLDAFAVLVLLVAVASGLAILLILGIAPGYVARRRGHPWAQAVSVAGWITLVFGLVFWPLAFIWAYVDFPTRAPATAPEPLP
jgi:vacuolar-type H+-ATPase subunit I/STV1